MHANNGSSESLLEAYVRSAGGTRVVKSILIANNGMAATKFCISIRQWLQGVCNDPQAIKIVSMVTPDDLRANAKHLQLSHSVVEVPGGPSAENYGNVDLIIAVAKRHGVDVRRVRSARWGAYESDAAPPVARLHRRFGPDGATRRRTRSFPGAAWRLASALSGPQRPPCTSSATRLWQTLSHRCAAGRADDGVRERGRSLSGPPGRARRRRRSPASSGRAAELRLTPAPTGVTAC